MFGRARRALERARDQGASYADIRIRQSAHEGVHVKNGVADAVERDESIGFGVRVIADGAWGFASSNTITDDELERVADLAVQIARASARLQPQPVKLAPLDPVVQQWTAPVKEDPFAVPMDEKTRILLEANRLAREVPGVRVAECFYNAFRTHQWFASSEGSEIEQERTECGGGMKITATGNGEVQTRSYPASLEGLHQLAGFEVIRELDLPSHAEETAKECVALMDADPCPSGQMDIVLEASQMALQVHESCGHPTEADRAFGMEAAFAGNTFLTPEQRGTFRYGSEHVTIRADATAPRGLGTFAYDDEGVPAHAFSLIDHGIFTHYLSSRETAAALGLPHSAGAMRASSWNRLPLIRMTNINLQPGDFTLDELIRDISHGLYLVTTKSWSIDDVRLNFQFATEVGYEITDGSLGRVLRNCTYQGITPEFWGSCDGVGTPDEWRMWGTLRCGKGEPPQSMHVGHGTAPARFRKVRVGIYESTSEGKE